MISQHAKAVQTILKRTAQLIRTDGWCQHTTTKPSGECCLSYALSRAGRTYGLQSRWDARNAVLETIRSTFRRHNTHIIEWNDTRGRNKAQVLTVLRKAATVVGKHV